MSNAGLTSSWIQSFALCQGKLFAGSGEEGIFISDDAGLSWSSIIDGPESNNIISMTSDDENVYVGTDDDGVYVTYDLGVTWQKLGDDLDNNMIMSLGLSGTNILAGTYSNGMYISTDGGDSWEQVLNGIQDNLRINSIVTYDTMAIAGCDDGIVRISYDNGDSWYHLGDDLPGKSVLSVWAEDDYIYAGLNAGGVWRCPTDIITGYEFQYLEQEIFISPNPASAIVRIIPGFSKCELNVFNPSGSIIHKAIVEDEISIDVSDWVQGTYVVICYRGNEMISSLLLVY